MKQQEGSRLSLFISRRVVYALVALLCLAGVIAPRTRAAQTHITVNTTILAGNVATIPAADEWIVDPGITLTIFGSLFVEGRLTVQGVLNSSNQLTNNGVVNISGDWENSGVCGNNNLIMNTGDISNSGELRNLPGGQIWNTSANSDIDNTGLIWNRDRIYNAFGSIVNQAGAEFKNRPEAEFYTFANFDNFGLFRNRGHVNNTGQFDNLDGGTVENKPEGFFYNEGGFANNDSTVNEGVFVSESNASVDNVAGTISNESSGSIFNRGWFNNAEDTLSASGSLLVNMGYFLNDDTAVLHNDDKSAILNSGDGAQIENSFTIENRGLMQNYATFTNNQTFDNTDGSYVNFCGSLFVNNGTSLNIGSGAANMGTGTFLNPGTWSGNPISFFFCP